MMSMLIIQHKVNQQLDASYIWRMTALCTIDPDPSLLCVMLSIQADADENMTTVSKFDVIPAEVNHCHNDDNAIADYPAWVNQHLRIPEYHCWLMLSLSWWCKRQMLIADVNADCWYWCCDAKIPVLFTFQSISRRQNKCRAESRLDIYCLSCQTFIYAKNPIRTEIWQLKTNCPVFHVDIPFSMVLRISE